MKTINSRTFFSGYIPRRGFAQSLSKNTIAKKNWNHINDKAGHICQIWGKCNNLSNAQMTNRLIQPNTSSLYQHWKYLTCWQGCFCHLKLVEGWNCLEIVLHVASISLSQGQVVETLKCMPNIATQTDIRIGCKHS